MNQTVAYLLMAVIIFLILFLIIRFVLQMIFLKECPNCGKLVSLAAGRTCPSCGFVFLKNKQAKLNLAIGILVALIALFVFLDVYDFRKQTDAFYRNNPYLWREEAAQSTEAPADGQALPSETPEGGDGQALPAEVPADQLQQEPSVPAQETPADAGTAVPTDPTAGEDPAQQSDTNPVAGIFQDLVDSIRE